MSLVFDIALKHLSRRRRQSLVSLTGVALGVGFFIAIAAMMQGFQDYFVEKVIDVSPHVEMRDEFREAPLQAVERLYDGGAVEISGIKPEDEVRGIKQGRAKLLQLGQEPGLAAAGALYGQAILRFGSKDVSGTLVGIEPERERRVSRLERDLIGGTLDDLYSTANGLVLGKGLADKLGAQQGDTLTVLSPTGAIMKMKIVAIFETGIVTLDNFQAYALLRKVQVLMDRPNVVNRIRIRLDDVDLAEVTARRLEERYGYRTESWQESNQNVLGLFVLQNAIMYSTTGAILLVAAFGIFNIISTVVLEKTRDIAILKAMGFSARDVVRIFLAEGFLVGVVGMLVGWALGYGLIQVMAAVDFKIDGFVRTEGFILARSPWHYAISGAMALAASCFAAYLPARRAAALDPVTTIRGAA